MKNALAGDLFAHALCDERSRRRLAVGAALRRSTEDASLDEACVDGGAEFAQLIHRVADIMAEAIKQSKKITRQLQAKTSAGISTTTLERSLFAPLYIAHRPK